MASSSRPWELISLLMSASSSNVQSLPGSPARPRPESSPHGWSPGWLLSDQFQDQKHLARQLAIGVIMRATQHSVQTRPLASKQAVPVFMPYFLANRLAANKKPSPRPTPTHTSHPSSLGSSAISQLTKMKSPSMCKILLLRALIGSRHATASPAVVHSELFTGRQINTRAPDNGCCPTENFNRRDQRADCYAPLRKPRARHERQCCWPQQRQPSVCGSAAALRSDSVPAVSPSPLHCFRSPTADRSLIKEICHQPKNFFELQAVGGTWPRESLTR